jgi:NAD(P)-dependent dehydrogenase (short-subunit alcohol dehydrogenase family)
VSLGVTIDVVGADLTDRSDLARIEARLRDDDSIGILVNNAGVAAPGGFANADLELMDRLIRLNVMAVTRLAGAVVPRFLARGEAPSSISRRWWASRRRFRLAPMVQANPMFWLSHRACKRSLAAAASMSRRCCPRRRERKSGRSPAAM